MFNVVICTVNRTTQTDGIQREKAALNSHWEIMSHLTLVFRWKKDQILYTPLQQTNEQSPTTTYILTL